MSVPGVVRARENIEKQSKTLNKVSKEKVGFADANKKIGIMEENGARPLIPPPTKCAFPLLLPVIFSTFSVYLGSFGFIRFRGASPLHYENAARGLPNLLRVELAQKSSIILFFFCSPRLGWMFLSSILSSFPF